LRLAKSELRDPVDKLSQSFHARYIPKLDALRAISALLVMLYHFNLPIPAGFGVTCFFVISGFLITRLLLEEQDRTGRVSLSAFYVRRGFRIFPAFYVYWIFITAWYVFRHKIIWGQAFSSFFYICNYYQGLHHYPSTSYARTWSLGVEEQFYLLWPWMFSHLSSNRGRLLKVLVSIIAGIWGFRIVLYLLGAPEEYLYTAFECRADAIFVGCALAISLHSGFFPRLWAALCSHRWKLFLNLAALCGSLVLFRHYGTPYRDTAGHLLEPLLMGAIIVQLLGIDWPALNWMDSRPIRFLGAMSYSTYLYHGLVPLPAGVPVFFEAIPSYALAALSYLGVERPMLRLRDTVFSRRRGSARLPGLVTSASGATSTPA
jgi:peptidoglycan/LPS O-acetylase OafA/YrhL